MPQKRFDHPNETLTDQRGHAGVRLPDGVEIGSHDQPGTAAYELYERLGVNNEDDRFPVRWEPWATAQPLIDPDGLPSGVTESDVETVLANMKADGYL